MGTRSRSARNATQSFPSKMIFRSRNNEDERVRMSIEASSLFIPEGKHFSTADSKEAMRIIREESPVAVVLLPSMSVLNSPRSWANALSSASFLVVIGDGSLKKYRAFMSILDNIIFSPVPRKLSSAFITDDRARVEALISSVSDTIGNVITISALDS